MGAIIARAITLHAGGEDSGVLSASLTLADQRSFARNYRLAYVVG